MPPIPQASLPSLQLAKHSALTRTLASASPKGLAALPNALAPPSSPSRSSSKSPVKRSSAVTALAVPFPVTPAAKNTHTQNPSSRGTVVAAKASPLTPRTPSNAESTLYERPCTPNDQQGAGATTAPAISSTSRRAALYERVRQRSLTTTPSKPSASKYVQGGSLTKDQMLKMGQDEMRRRCLLGRLDGVADSVWM